MSPTVIVDRSMTFTSCLLHLLLCFHHGFLPRGNCGLSSFLFLVCRGGWNGYVMILFWMNAVTTSAHTVLPHAVVPATATIHRGSNKNSTGSDTILGFRGQAGMDLWSLLFFPQQQLNTTTVVDLLSGDTLHQHQQQERHNQRNRIVTFTRCLVDHGLLFNYTPATPGKCVVVVPGTRSIAEQVKDVNI